MALTVKQTEALLFKAKADAMAAGLEEADAIQLAEGVIAADPATVADGEKLIAEMIAAVKPAGATVASGSAPSAVGGKPPARQQSSNGPVYKKVRLKKAIDYKGQVYRPGVWHIMDAAMVTDLGDKVLEALPHVTEEFYKQKAS